MPLLQINMLDILKNISIAVVSAIFMITSCNTPDSNEDIENITVALAVDREYGDPQGIVGWPITIDAIVSGIPPRTNLFLHIFHRERGSDTYYYDDTNFIDYLNTELEFTVWLGNEYDTQKEYEIFAIVNTESRYDKYQGIYSTRSLPQTYMESIIVYRR